MDSYLGVWALCGGWAVDAWLGRLTREHGDLDLIVFQDDLPQFREHLSDWQLVAHDEDVAGNTSELWNGRRLTLPAHIHARRDEGVAMPENMDSPDGQGFGLDIQICERSETDWIMTREPRIGMSLESSIQESSWGLPTVSPEVLLFYKGWPQDDVGFLRRRDKLDFAALLPTLGGPQREWLRSAIELVGHPWLARLSS